MNILVKEFIIGKVCLEDAILLKDVLSSVKEGICVLDFQGIDKVPTTFFLSLFNDIINEKGREYVMTKFKVINLVNEEDYYRVILGTCFVHKV